MSLYVIDTDTLSVYQRGQPGLTAKVDTHPPQELSITVITVEEEGAGWYALLRQARRPEEQAGVYKRLAEAIPVLARWQILLMTIAAISRYESLRRMNLNVRKMDLRIAAIVFGAQWCARDSKRPRLSARPRPPDRRLGVLKLTLAGRGLPSLPGVSFASWALPWPRHSLVGAV